MKIRILSGLLAAATISFAAAPLHLLQKPAMNNTQIVFSYAGDLWTVSRNGGVANRLTGGQGIETLVSFSPDGETIAFTGQYDGNTDVFTVPVNLAGLPGISVPGGLSAEGLPLGLQLIGRPFGEETLFSLAQVMEQAAGRFSPQRWW